MRFFKTIVLFPLVVLMLLALAIFLFVLDLFNEVIRLFNKEKAEEFDKKVQDLADKLTEDNKRYFYDKYK